MVMRPVCPGLVWGLVVDDEDRVQVLMSASYEELGAGPDELWPVARDNLYKLSLGQFREVVPGVFASPFGDSHDAARLLLPDLFNDLNLKGPPVASAPRPEALLVADGNDPAAIARLAVISRELAEQSGRSVSPIVVVHDGQSWQPLKLERANPARVEVEMNARIARGRDYSEQSELLERREAKAGRDCFVATPSLVRNEETGESFLWTVWPPNVTDALLPEADVVFIGEVEQARAARWSDVQRVFGDRMKREGDSLPRWRVGAGPWQADLAALETAVADDVWRLLESAPA
jgi:hypothetical protein